MSSEDQDRWDRRYLDTERAESEHADTECAEAADLEPPAGFRAVVDMLPDVGVALDVACGAGEGSVWLAQRGLDVLGVDVSPVAVDLARRLATSWGVEANCRFVAHDLDLGLPTTSTIDLITCHLFSAPNLDAEILERLALGGTLAIAVLSEVGGETGPFRAKPGELLERFGALDVRHHEELDGRATLVAVATGPLPSGRLD
jgi:SAM-dependent methyltransferase